jgi:hypothetical protein
MQTKVQSVIEVVINVVSGYLLCILVQLVAYPFYGIQISLEDNIQLATLFLVMSLLRNYFWRRFWNHMHKVKSK